jgi:hypothetical protein
MMGLKDYEGMGSAVIGNMSLTVIYLGGNAPFKTSTDPSIVPSWPSLGR